MKAQKQQRLYGVLVGITVVLLLAAQYILQYTFTSVSVELATVSESLDGLKKSAVSKSGLVDKYKQFEMTAGPSNQSKTYPENGRELYEVLDAVLNEHNIGHDNKSYTGGTAPGGVLQLQITFNGPYYGLLKSLAAIRESRYVMRISDFKISAKENGQVEGSMTVLSTARS
ncbi:MAG: hypothetical protein LBQ56_03595 [Synergistaceae bacterium]|jgi:hypothetical protein|nr:hypothetical protein [Synergistaceae bacterium]